MPSSVTQILGKNFESTAKARFQILVKNAKIFANKYANSEINASHETLNELQNTKQKTPKGKKFIANLIDLVLIICVKPHDCVIRLYF